MDANSLEKHMKKYLDYCENQKGISHKTVKAYLCAITQLVGVLLADSIHKLSLFKSLRKLIA